MPIPEGPAVPRFGKWRLALVILFIITLLAAILFLFVLPRIPAVRSWRSEQLAREAIKAMETGDWPLAQTKTIASFQLDPKNPAALRSAAKLNMAAGMPQALIFYRALVATGHATGEDRIHYSEALLREASYSAFLQEIAEAGKQLPDDPRIQLLLANYAFSAGDWSAVGKILTPLLSSATLPLSLKTPAAEMLLAVPVPESRRLAAEWVLGISSTKNPDSARLLDTLLSTSDIPQDLRNRATTAVEKIPGRRFEGRIQSATAHLRAHPGDREQVFQSLLKEANSPDDRRALASFFVRTGENQRALDLLPLATARTRKDSFLVWLDATAGLGRWDDVLNALKSGTVPLEPALYNLFVARCQEALGRQDVAESYFERAAETPTEDRALLFYLAGYFNQQHRLPLAEIVLRRLAGDPLASRKAYESLVNLHRIRGNSKELLDVLEEMTERWPKDPAVANDVNYLLLLQERDIARTLERSRRLLEENPGLFPLKITHALALLRTGRATEGLELFANSEIQFGQLLPGQKAVFAALLKANGREDTAEAVRNGLKNSALLPEENALIAEPNHTDTPSATSTRQAR